MSGPSSSPEPTLHQIVLNRLREPHADDKIILDLLRLQEKCEIDDTKYARYSPEIIAKLGKLLPRPGPMPEQAVTVTMTSCKRYDLFQQTVNSFLACCTDLDVYIWHWLVVDDNSSQEDRLKMQANYPFIDFIFKTPQEKGHARSMNILLEKIKTPYVFHLEDDWRFFLPDDFLGKCFTVLAQNSRLGQCLLNRAYGEDIIMGPKIAGGYRRYVQTPKGPLRYYIHEYLVNDALEKTHALLARHGLTHCVYWPHYSLRVGLTRREVLASVGVYNEQADHFEREYAYRYVEKGFLTAYLDNVFCSHIGRRTYERESDKVNAYDLNSEQQFGQAPKSTPGSPSESSSSQASLPEPKRQLIMKVLVLNLLRRPDRLEEFRRKNDGELHAYQVFKAIDGLKLSPNHKLQKLFDRNDYNYRRGIVGCALSHLAMWTDPANANIDAWVILEDDAELSPNFASKLMHVISSTPEADIIFLGHHPYPAFADPQDLDRTRIPTTSLWTREKCIAQSMGGTTGYYITRRGIRNVLEFIDRNSIINGIDWVMFKTACSENNPKDPRANRIYYCSPFIAFAECTQSGKTTDTDIQYVYDGVGYPEMAAWLQDEIGYFLKLTDETGLAGDPCKIGNIEYPQDEKSQVGYCQNFPPKKLLLTKILVIARTSPEDRLKLRLFPVNTYTVGPYLLSVPENLCSPELLKEKTFGGFLNRYDPLGALVSVV